MDLELASQEGLRWEEHLFWNVPKWTREPRIEDVEVTARRALGELSTFKIDFFGQGAFNKLYKIRCDHGNFMMRVSLPVDPKFKTMSEVATLTFVSQMTELPTPQVSAYDSSRDSPIGFEWILMDLLPGEALQNIWPKLAWEVKKAIVKRIALYSAQAFRNRSSQIGNLFFAHEYPQDQRHVRFEPAKWSSVHLRDALSPSLLGRMVSLDFFQSPRLHLDVPRGPFPNSSQWLHARLRLIKTDCKRTIAESKDEDDIEEAKDDLAFAIRIEKAMPKIISPSLEPETTVLHHADLNAQNVLATENGTFVGLVDWECVSTVPLWKAAQFPAFIETRDRFHEPKEESYAHDGEHGEVNSLFHEHVMEWESTLLRQVFWVEMEKLEPEWIKAHQESRMMRDLEEAINLCGVGWISKSANRWLDVIENGREPQELSKRERAFEEGHETIDSD